MGCHSCLDTGWLLRQSVFHLLSGRSRAGSIQEVNEICWPTCLFPVSAQSDGDARAHQWLRHGFLGQGGLDDLGQNKWSPRKNVFRPIPAHLHYYSAFQRLAFARYIFLQQRSGPLTSFPDIFDFNFLFSFTLEIFNTEGIKIIMMKMKIRRMKREITKRIRIRRRHCQCWTLYVNFIIVRTLSDGGSWLVYDQFVRCIRLTDDRRANFPSRSIADRFASLLIIQHVDQTNDRLPTLDRMRQNKTLH